MKNALIVGASRGLGLGLVKELLGNGYNVVATKRPRGASKTNVEELEALDAQNEELVVYDADIRDGASCEALLKTLDGQMNGHTFDVVFINAGIMGAVHQRVDQATDAELLDIIKTKVAGPMRLARLLAPRVVENTGVLAVMTSQMGSISDSSGGYELYRMSKVSLNMLMHGLAQEDAVTSRGLTLLNVHPGWVQTDMGGAGAPLSVEDSVRGIREMLEARAGTGKPAFVSYRNEEIAW